MRTNRLNPQTLIQQVVNDAKNALGKVSQDGSLSRAQVAQLPTVLQGVADTFVGVQDTVQADAITKAIQKGLEATLKGSLDKGQLLREELTPGLVGLLSLSSMGVQVEKMLAAQEPLSVADAERQAESALRRATPGLKSQLEIYKALEALQSAIDRDDPTDGRAGAVKDLVGQRGKLMRESVNTSLQAAEQAFQQVGSGQSKHNLERTLQAAHDVYSTVLPQSSRLRQLGEQATQLGVRLGNDAAQVQPFFARFLENQNRGPRPGDGEVARVATDGEAATHARSVTEKAPSDHEDMGADADGAPAVTRKAPSDHEDGGVDNPGDMVTLKAPSDNEDGGDGGGIGDMVTQKFPSDTEDGGGDIGDITTEKYPSDAEDGGPGDGGDIGMPVTRKFPSDNEDGGDGGVGVGAITEKAPSDEEDGGADPGVDPGTMVTLKYPSDNEDGGGNVGDITTEKYPSDAEDGGVGDGGGDGGIGAVTEKFPSDADEDGGIGDITTEKYPSDAEDGGADVPDDPGMNVTLKYPSDHEDGGAGGNDPGDIMVTMKFPSDNEDGGAGDAGGIGDVVTAKFPSDAEDGGVGDGGDGGDGGGGTDIGDIGDVVTAKYPSDAEDGGAGDAGDGGGIGNVTTAKFPSDNEDGGNQ